MLKPSVVKLRSPIGSNNVLWYLSGVGHSGPKGYGGMCGDGKEYIPPEGYDISAVMRERKVPQGTNFKDLLNDKERHKLESFDRFRAYTTE